MAEAVTAVFAPKRAKGAPNLLLAEAGTGHRQDARLSRAGGAVGRAGGRRGVGLDLHQGAAAAARRAKGPKLFADADERERRIVVRKGRENYLCLLNLEDALQGAFAGRAAILAQLVGRWAAYTKDGDMVGGDLPGWLPSLFRRAGAAALTDRRGECVYAGCPHYRRCFIERAERASREADIVIANHALVMVNAARAREDAPGRILFDEGHHLFDAADSTFAVAFGGQEAIELRRWIVGPEGRSRGRRRGLAARLMDVASYDEEGAQALEAAVEAAKALPSDGWLQRLVEGAPFGPVEALLAEVRGTVYARAKAQEAGYGLETELAEPDGALVSHAAAARRNSREPAEAARRAGAPARSGARGRARLARLAGAGAGRRRDPRARRGGARRSPRGSRCSARIGGEADPEFVDWLAVERVDGREYDVAIHRRWLDPTKPLARAVLAPADGVLVTSATLARRRGLAGRRSAHRRVHLPLPAQRFEAESPFDYAGCSEVLIVTDIKQGDIASLAGAYARLIEAAKGGTWPVHRDPAAESGARPDRRPAGARGLPLLAQHVDPIDAGTLVDIFRRHVGSTAKVVICASSTISHMPP